jgi:hypothetical protein
MNENHQKEVKVRSYRPTSEYDSIGHRSSTVTRNQHDTGSSSRSGSTRQPFETRDGATQFDGCKTRRESLLNHCGAGTLGSAI